MYTVFADADKSEVADETKGDVMDRVKVKMKVGIEKENETKEAVVEKQSFP